MHEEFMRAAIAESKRGMDENEGGPFGAVIVKNGKIIGRGNNKVTSTNDPTAHAEVTAIRAACTALENFDLSGAEIYTSCEPCPMCLAAIFWARIDKIYYANTKKDAAAINFDDDFFYQEIDKPLDKRSIPMTQIMREDAIKVFQAWTDKTDKIAY